MKSEYFFTGKLPKECTVLGDYYSKTGLDLRFSITPEGSFLVFAQQSIIKVLGVKENGEGAIDEEIKIVEESGNKIEIGLVYCGQNQLIMSDNEGGIWRLVYDTSASFLSDIKTSHPEKLINSNYSYSTLISIALSPDNEWMIYADDQSYLCLANIKNENPVETLAKRSFNENQIQQTVWISELEFAVSFRGSNSVYIFDVNTFHDHISHIELKLPSIEDTQSPSKEKTNYGPSLAFSKKDNLLYASTSIGDLFLIDLADLSKKPQFLFPSMEGRIADIAISPDGKTLCVRSKQCLNFFALDQLLNINKFQKITNLYWPNLTLSHYPTTVFLPWMNTQPILAFNTELNRIILLQVNSNEISSGRSSVPKYSGTKKIVLFSLTSFLEKFQPTEYKKDQVKKLSIINNKLALKGINGQYSKVTIENYETETEENYETISFWNTSRNFEDQFQYIYELKEADLAVLIFDLDDKNTRFDQIIAWIKSIDDINKYLSEQCRVPICLLTPIDKKDEILQGLEPIDNLIPYTKLRIIDCPFENKATVYNKLKEELNKTETILSNYAHNLSLERFLRSKISDGLQYCIEKELIKKEYCNEIILPTDFEKTDVDDEFEKSLIYFIKCGLLIPMGPTIFGISSDFIQFCSEVVLRSLITDSNTVYFPYIEPNAAKKELSKYGIPSDAPNEESFLDSIMQGLISNHLVLRRGINNEQWIAYPIQRLVNNFQRILYKKEYSTPSDHFKIYHLKGQLDIILKVISAKPNSVLTFKLQNNGIEYWLDGNDHTIGRVGILTHFVNDSLKKEGIITLYFDSPIGNKKQIQWLDQVEDIFKSAVAQGYLEYISSYVDCKCGEKDDIQTIIQCLIDNKNNKLCKKCGKQPFPSLYENQNNPQQIPFSFPNDYPILISNTLPKTEVKNILNRNSISQNSIWRQSDMKGKSDKISYYQIPESYNYRMAIFLGFENNEESEGQILNQLRYCNLHHISVIGLFEKEYKYRNLESLFNKHIIINSWIDLNKESNPTELLSNYLKKGRNTGLIELFKYGGYLKQYQRATEDNNTSMKRFFAAIIMQNIDLIDIQQISNKKGMANFLINESDLTDEWWKIPKYRMFLLQSLRVERKSQEQQEITQEKGIKIWRQWFEADPKDFKNYKIEEFPRGATHFPALVIKKLRLRNIQCFDEITIEFTLNTMSNSPRRCSLILGDNGLGKTLILKAIAICMLGLKDVNAMPEINPHKLLRSQKTEGEIEALFEFSIDEGASKIEKLDLSVGLKLSTHENNIAYLENGNMKFAKKNSALHLDELKKVQSFNGGFLCGYGVHRALRKIDDELEKDYQKNNFHIQSLFKPIYYLANPENVRKILLRKYQVSKSTDKDQIKSQILRSVLLKTIADLKIDIDGENPSIGYKDNKNLDIEELSDGVNSIMGLVTHLVQQGFNIAYSPEESFKMPRGIVLIDEIDLHLHPKWQETCLSSLIDCFPTIQFIVTTHSPIVIRSVPDYKVMALEQSNKTNKKIIINEKGNVYYSLNENITKDPFQVSYWNSFTVKLRELFYLLHTHLQENDDHENKYDNAFKVVNDILEFIELSPKSEKSKAEYEVEKILHRLDEKFGKLPDHEEIKNIYDSFRYKIRLEI